PDIGVVTKTTSYPLEQANKALADLRAGRFEGAAVLVP
ncbi:MAG: alcohol dehydrogenase, partial [Bradyrhizobium sp.]